MGCLRRTRDDGRRLEAERFWGESVECGNRFLFEPEHRTGSGDEKQIDAMGDARRKERLGLRLGEEEIYGGRGWTGLGWAGLG